MLVKVNELIKVSGSTAFSKRFVLLVIGFVTSLSALAINPHQYVATQTSSFITLNGLFSHVPDFLWFNLTFMGDALVALPIMSFFCLLNPRTWAAFFAAVPAAMTLSHVGKSLFAIPRPAAVLEQNSFNIIGDTLTAHTSFPSGHTITVFTVIFVVIFTNDYFKKRGALIAIFSFAILVALSRVAVGAHWPFDLILGAIFGAIAGLHGSHLTRNSTSWWYPLKRNSNVAAVTVFLFPVSIVFLSLNGDIPSIPIIWMAVGASSTVGSILFSRASTEK